MNNLLKMIRIYLIASTLLVVNFAHAQQCLVDMVDNIGRVVQTISARGDANSCMEGMKECRKAIRLSPHLGGVDCIRRTHQPSPMPTMTMPPRPPGPPTPIPTMAPPMPPGPIGGIPHVVARMDLLSQAIHFALQGCHVLPKVSGWANQLYIRDVFSGNFQVGTDDMHLMRTIRDYQLQGYCLLKPVYTLQLQFERNIIQEAISHRLSRNCHVLPKVSGWANQLYVNGNFSGNFDINIPSDQFKLAGVLANHVANGTCMTRSLEELRLLEDRYLIQDFANFQYRGCHVKLNVSGWANQLYIRNVFSGNFDKNTEVVKLQAKLIDYIMNGSCIYDPI